MSEIFQFPSVLYSWLTDTRQHGRLLSGPIRMEYLNVLEWTDKMSVGSEALDEDHKRLIGMLKELNIALKAGSPAETIRDIMTELSAYADYHFAAEERVLRMARYEGLEEHIEAHNKWRERLVEMKTTLEGKADRRSALKLSDFLSDWLIRHILGDDQKFKPALAALANRRKPEQDSGGAPPATES